jgi:hypothetical protein
LLTLNGGATIAFLTFIGHLGEKGSLSSASSDSFIYALGWFIAGSLLAVLGYCMIFVTNTLSLEGHAKTSTGFFFATCAFVLLALVAFSVASCYAVQGFRSVTPS